VKQNLRNSLILGSFALTCLQAGVGCSAEDAGPGIGSSAGTFSNTAGTTTSAAGTTAFPTAGTSSTSGSGSGGTSSFGGAFATSGAFSTAGTDTAGTAAGGTAAGSGGAGTAGTATAGTGTGGTAPTVDFPANCPAPTGTHSADKLTRTCWKASASSCSLGNAAGLVNPPSNALDADLTTRFSTGDKMVTSKQFTFDIDMGKAVMINGVSTATVTATDIPPQVQVAVSTDGTTWTPVACGTNSPNADISFAAVSARYVRLIGHGTADAWWSMVDVNVYRSGADDTCGAGATTTACTSIGTAFPDTCCGADKRL
jgi:hypothetical protein